MVHLVSLWSLRFVKHSHAQSSACAGIAGLRSIFQVHQCIDELLAIGTFGEDMQNSLSKAKRNVEAGREACTATEQRATMLGCRELSDLSYELLAEGAAVIYTCTATPEACSSRSRAASESMVRTWQTSEMQHRFLPSASLVSNKLNELTSDIISPLMREEPGTTLNPLATADSAPMPWRAATIAADQLKMWLQGYIWRETHWLWLSDSIEAGKVVHTAWGPPEEWNEKFGVHDCNADSPLTAPGPSYVFSDLTGMRWEVLVALLTDLWHSRGAKEPLVVVEIGVFAGMLAQQLLKDLDFIMLIGIDPYIGSDGTFPGNFSDTLDPDVAMAKAMSVMQPYGQRAQLVPMSSKEAAAQIGPGEVDAIFVDGCHYYDCVREDLDMWLPKLRRGVETLVAGHDFSPQWPGVVRAVHERRAGGHQVSLASDWVFWWHEQLPP